MKTIKSTFLGLALWLLSFTFYVPYCRAQQLKLSLTPPQIEILMKSNVSLVKTFELENNGDPGVFSISVVSFEPVGDQGGRVFKDKAEGPIRFSLENSQIDFNQRFFLDSREHVQAILKIRSIENAPLGDYYYTLFFVSDPPVSQISSGKSSAMIGANILISITESGLTSAEGRIAQFQIIPRHTLNLFGLHLAIVEPGDEVPVILKMANTGDYLIQPQAKIGLRGPFGIKKQRKLLPLNILRNSERILLPKELDECQRCTTTPSVVFQGLFYGKYLLSADVGFKGNNKKIFSQTEFWVFPIQLTKYVLIGFLICLLLLFFFKNRYNDVNR